VNLDFYESLLEPGLKISGKRMKELMIDYKVDFRYPRSGNILLHSDIDDDDMFEYTGEISVLGNRFICYNVEKIDDDK